MRLSRLVAALPLLLCTSLAANADGPAISGRYVISRVATCYTPEPSFANVSGYAVFDPVAGTVAANGFEASGQPPALNPFSGTTAYSNTATEITVAGHVYKIFYGAVVGGIATYASYIGVFPVPGGSCTYHLIISRAGAE